MEFIRLEICTLFTLSHFQTPHSNTLTQTPKSVTLNPSECNKTHPHPQTLSSFLTIGFRWSPHPYLQHPFCPYQRKFRFFQVLRYVFSFVCSFIENWEMKNNLWCGKGTFSYKNLSFLNNYSPTKFDIFWFILWDCSLWYEESALELMTVSYIFSWAISDFFSFLKIFPFSFI